MLIHPRCPKESPRAYSMGCWVPHPPWDSRPVPNNVLTPCGVLGMAKPSSLGLAHCFQQRHRPPSTGCRGWPSHPGTHTLSHNRLANLLCNGRGGRATLGLMRPSPVQYHSTDKFPLQVLGCFAFCFYWTAAAAAAAASVAAALAVSAAAGTAAGLWVWVPLCLCVCDCIGLWLWLWI